MSPKVALPAIRRPSAEKILNRARSLRGSPRSSNVHDIEETELARNTPRCRRGTKFAVSFADAEELSHLPPDGTCGRGSTGLSGPEIDKLLPIIGDASPAVSPVPKVVVSVSSRASPSPLELPSIPQTLEWRGTMGDFVDQLTPHLQDDDTLAKTPKEVSVLLQEMGEADSFFLGGFLQGELVGRRPDLQRNEQMRFSALDARKIGLGVITDSHRIGLRSRERSLEPVGPPSPNKRRTFLDVSNGVLLASAKERSENHPRREAIRAAKQRAKTKAIAVSSLTKFFPGDRSQNLVQKGIDHDTEAGEESSLGERKSVRISEDDDEPHSPTSSRSADSELKRRNHRSLERSSSMTQHDSEDEKLLTSRRREACESLRILVFGEIGNENWKNTDRSRIFEQSRGTYEEVGSFSKLWQQIDEDGSDDIDFGEFLEFFARSKADRLLCMRCVRYLLGRNSRKAQLNTSTFSARMSRDSSAAKCTREDMMRLIWLKATAEDINLMYQMFDLHKLEEVRVPTPPLLPKKKRKQLLENFRFLDKEDRGLIAYTDLVEGGLVDEEIMKALQVKYDRHGRGFLDQDDFLEMLCPYGCRAHEGVRRIVNKEDKLIQLVTCDVRHLHCGFDSFDGWLHEDDIQEITKTSSLPLNLP